MARNVWIILTTFWHQLEASICLSAWELSSQRLLFSWSSWWSGRSPSMTGPSRIWQSTGILSSTQRFQQEEDLLPDRGHSLPLDQDLPWRSQQPQSSLGHTRTRIAEAQLHLIVQAAHAFPDPTLQLPQQHFGVQSVCLLVDLGLENLLLPSGYLLGL